MKINHFPNINTLEELKSAYRKLAKQFHPDINKAPEALQTMKTINTQFEIPRYNENKTGVYSITLDNNIYIGSTVKGFRERFREHIYKNNPLTHTYEMMQNGGIFKTLWIAKDGTEELTIRQKEKEYIECYIGLSEWNVINLKYGYKTAYNNIKIKKNDYDTVVSLLQDNNIYYKG